MADTTGNQHGLTDLQLKFANEYLKDLNGTQAYIRAGYKAKSYSAAGAGASDLLKNPKIRAYLGEVANLSEVGIMSEIISCAFGKVTDVLEIKGGQVNILDTDKWSDRAKASVESVTVVETFKEDGSSSVKTQVKMHPKLTALEKLMKKFKMYPTERGTLELVAAMLEKGLLIPAQAEVIKHGADSIEEGLRSLSGISTPEAEE